MNDLDRKKVAFAKGFAIGQLIKLKKEIQDLIDFEESCCGDTTLGYQCLGAIKDRITELKGKKYELGNCPCCQKTDLVIVDKKIICNSCNNWSWLEDAYNSSWLKEPKRRIQCN